MEKAKYLGRFWNNKQLEVYKIDGRNIVLNGWNGEKYIDCFELDNNLIDIIKKDIEVIEINTIFYDEDGEVDRVELADLKIIYN